MKKLFFCSALAKIVATPSVYERDDMLVSGALSWSVLH